MMPNDSKSPSTYVKDGISSIAVLILLTSFTLTGCGGNPNQSSAEEAAEEAFGEGFDLSEPDDGDAIEGMTSGPAMPCPSETRTVKLWYDHTCVLKMSTPTDELYLAETSVFEPFVLQIRANGEVEADMEQQIMLTMEGQFLSSTDFCPITNYKGTYPIRAEISGECRNGIVDLHIKLERINFNLEGDCHLSEGFVMPQPSSAPEIDHSFVLRQTGDAYKMEVPPGGALAGIPNAVYCTYLFLLLPEDAPDPEEYQLEPVPLVPPEE